MINSCFFLKSSLCCKDKFMHWRRHLIWRGSISHIIMGLTEQSEKKKSTLSFDLTSIRILHHHTTGDDDDTAILTLFYFVKESSQQWTGSGLLSVYFCDHTSKERSDSQPGQWWQGKFQLVHTSNNLQAQKSCCFFTVSCSTACLSFDSCQTLRTEERGNKTESCRASQHCDNIYIYNCEWVQAVQGDPQVSYLLTLPP